MKAFSLVLFAAAATTAAAQAVTEILKPTAANPAGCRPSVTGSFNIYRDVLAKRGDIVEKDDTSGALTIYLNNTVLTDSLGRTGAIVANYQFQFDGPPQAGTIYTAGWCLLPNNSLVLGNSPVFWACNSGGFDNLYDRYWADQCRPVLLQAFGFSDDQTSSSASSSASASSTASSSGTSGVSSISSRASSSASASVAASSLSSNLTSLATSLISSAHSATATAGTSATGSATNRATTTAPAPTATNAASSLRAGDFAFVMGLIGLVGML